MQQTILSMITLMQPARVAPFHRAGWIYEEKIDGWRMLALKDRGRVRLVSRQGIHHTARFAELAVAITRLPAPSIVLDGEVAVFDDKLISRFHLLGEPDPTIVTTPPVFIAFDCLSARGRDLRGRPLAERRHQLEREIDGAELVLPVRRLAGDGLAAWREVQERGYEGLVGKDERSTYVGGFAERVRAGRLALREVMWLEPHVVAEIRYAEIVQDRLRAPVFRGFYSAPTLTTRPAGLLSTASVLRRTRRARGTPTART